MSSDPVPPKQKIPWVKLLVVAILLGGGALFALRGSNPREWVEKGMDLIRSAGPVVFFGAMAVLPAIGAPLLAFTLSAGEAFAPRFSMGGVIAICLAVIAFNLALNYWLARYALRPLLLKLLTRYGYKIPTITPQNALSVGLVVRLTPGPPYCLQGYMLGLAEMPFGLYMIVSWLCVLPVSIGAIVMGRGILNGNFKVAATGLGVLVVAVVLVQVVRKKFSAKQS